MMFDAWIFGFTVVGSAMLLATLGVYLVRRKVAFGTLKGHHEVAGYMLSIVATLYSVLLGLIVVDTQGKYQDAKRMSQQEADSCLDMFHLAYSLPMPTRKPLHDKLQSYLKILIDEEWKSSSADGFFNENAKGEFRDIWFLLNDFQPQTNGEQSCYEKMLDMMQNFADGRRYRLQITRAPMPAVMWFVLIAGGVLTILFTYLFEVEDVRAQALMTSLVALALSLNVLLVALFSNPYKGYMRITSYSFEYDLKVMQELLKMRPDS